MTNDGQSLIDPAVYQGPDQLQIANGSGLNIHSIGSSSLISRSQPLKLVNILHVPEIRKKLLSVYRLTNDNAVFVEFHANYCVVKEEETGKQLLRGTVKDGLYLLSQAHQPEVNLGEKTNLNIWHQRLGHPNMRTLQSIISKYGLPTSSVNKSISCDACMSSKSHHLPYSNSLHQTSKPLEVIHSDLWGPSPVTSHIGNRYYISFIDDYTKYTWLYPLKFKSDVLQVFIDFQKRIERHLNHKIVNFQSDWGGEFQALTKYLKEQGIFHRISCPHTPAQNGTAERKHRHIFETALSLLHQSSLPHHFWDEAVCTAVYLINRLPTQNLKNCSPYHLIYRQEPDYSLLKSFGCTCYPCLRPYATSKLDARSEKCIFIGYSAYHLGYRCLSLTNGKIYISRDVTFMEDHYPYKEHTSISHSNTHNISGLLGSSPAAADDTLHKNTSSSTFALPIPVIPRSPQQCMPPTTSPEQQQSVPISYEYDIPNNSSSNFPQDIDSPKIHTTGHTPSLDPLSPSNLDSHRSIPPTKTRRLSDIFRSIDSDQTPTTTKFPLPVCLHVSSSLPPDPVQFSAAIK